MSARALRRAQNLQNGKKSKDEEDNEKTKESSGNYSEGDRECDSDSTGEDKSKTKAKFSIDELDGFFGDDGDDDYGDGNVDQQDMNKDNEIMSRGQQNGKESCAQIRTEGAVKRKKKSKKKSNKTQASSNSNPQTPGSVDAKSAELDTDEELDLLIAQNSKLGLQDSCQSLINECMTTDAKHCSDMRQAMQLLSIDTRFLSAENEMIRMFGSEVLRSNAQKQKRSSHKQQQNRARNSYKLAKYPSNSPPIPNIGLSMKLLENSSSKEDVYYFKYVHSTEYQRAQKEFWSATHSIRHESLMQLLQLNGYHMDTLIQASNLLRMSDDSQNAALLVQRALCVAESAFHPLFSVTNGKCRLPYKYPENRSLFLAMFHHIHYLTKKGCHRTALEFSKLIYSLAPDEDPLSILLLIDCCALMSKQYKWLINFYKTWSPIKNLHQLPNFLYSLPLAQFLLHEEQSNNEPSKNLFSTVDLENALISFPSVLYELLNACSVDADSKTERNRYFGMSADSKQLPIVTQMCKLYVHRIYHLWKQPEVLKWLEVATKNAIERVSNADPLVDKSEKARQLLYKGTPRNVYRHFILSDIKEVSVNLPIELRSSSVYSYDPLPPPDTVLSYERPSSPLSQNRYPAGRNMLSTFLQALMPLYGVEQEALAQAGVRGFEMQRPIEVVDGRINPGVIGLNEGGDNQGNGEGLGAGDDVVGAVGGAGLAYDNLMENLRDWMRNEGNMRHPEHAQYRANPDEYGSDEDEDLANILAAIESSDEELGE